MQSKNKIFLDRTEVFLILGLVVLVAGLMFSLGLLVATGLTPKEGVATLTSAGQELLAPKKDLHSSNAETRKPSSEENIDKSSSNKLKAAFQKAKQRALVDMALKETNITGPKSVLDEKAHFEATNPGIRKPASVETEASPSLVKEGSIAKAPPSSVKSLFERAPSSKDIFEPIPGQYTVQIASYSTSDESVAKVANLRKSGFNQAYQRVIKAPKGDTWYRVAVGSYPTAEWAKKTGQQLIRRKLASDFVVRRVE